MDTFACFILLLTNGLQNLFDLFSFTLFVNKAQTKVVQNFETECYHDNRPRLWIQTKISQEQIS